MTLNRETGHPMIRQILLICTLTLSSSICLAGIYKWVDAEGNVHYGQQRPTDAASEKVQVDRYAPRDTSTYKKPSSKTANDQGADAGNETDAPENTPETEAEKKPEKKPETAAEKKRRLAACAKARQSMATMEAIGRIRSKDKDGNVTYMSQQQKEARMKQTRELIAKHCK